jgi:hypothetical protein
VFLLFVASQLLLRAVSVCGLLVVLVSDSGALAPSAENRTGFTGPDAFFVAGSQRLSTELGVGTLVDVADQAGLGGQLQQFSNESQLIGAASYEGGGYELLVAYIAIGFLTSLFFNSRYLQGLSQHTAPIMSVLNVFVAIDVSEYSLLSGAVPRPPRLPFFVFRMCDICLCLALFMHHLDQTVLPDAFKYAIVALVGLCPTLYCVCLLTPHSSAEPLSKSMSRALRVGAVKSEFHRAQRHPHQQAGGGRASGPGAWTAVASAAALLTFWLVLGAAGVWDERQVDRTCVNATLASERTSCAAQ